MINCELPAKYTGHLRVKTHVSIQEKQHKFNRHSVYSEKFKCVLKEVLLILKNQLQQVLVPCYKLNLVMLIMTLLDDKDYVKHTIYQTFIL
jgi:hypothetical protein